LVALVAAALSQAAAAYYAWITYNAVDNLFGGSGSQSLLLIASRAQALSSDADRAQFWMNTSNAVCAVAVIFLLVWSTTYRRSWGKDGAGVLSLFALVCTIGAVGARLYANQAAKDSTQSLLARFAESPGAGINAAFDLFLRLGRIEALGLLAGAAAAALLFVFVTLVERQS